MKNKELKKFDLENSVSGGPLDSLRLALSNRLDLSERKDLLIHVKYHKEENRYGFSIYSEK